MHQRLLVLAATAPVVLSAPILAACGTNGDAASGGGIAITATDDTCQVADINLKAGRTTFTVTNKGGKVTEVYVYGEQDGKYTKVVSEVENIGPGTTRDLHADLSGGSYEIACKPGQTGDGIRTRISVEGAAAAGDSTEGAYDREVEISATDTVLEHAEGLTAKVGEKIEFKLTNEGTKKRELEVLDPSGKVVAEVEVDAGATGEVVVPLSTAGTWQLKVEGGGLAELEAPIAVA
jgi:uncharacterized cupredoxin-like copper-binding protein